MRIVIAIIILLVLFTSESEGQTTWRMGQCIDYALENSNKTKIQNLRQENLNQDRKAAIGYFLPSLSGNVGVQSNFGRSIDPETNTYSTVSNFSNSYQLSGSIPIFNAGKLINNLRISKLAQLNGLSESQQVRNELAIAVIQAYIDLYFFQQLELLSERKLSESRQLLKATLKMEELGTRSLVDKLQMEALVAQDQYVMIHAINQKRDAIILLKNNMNYPVEEEVLIDTAFPYFSNSYNLSDPTSLFDLASTNHPIAKSSFLNEEIAKFNKKMVFSSLIPSFYLYGGVNTYFNKILTGDAILPAFGNQFANNLGEWVGISLSIPIFNGLYNHTQYKKAKNNCQIATYQHQETLRQLHAEIDKTVNEKSGLEKEMYQMEKQLEASQLAYQATKKRYELGMQSGMDLQTASNNLLQAQVNLLKIKLNLFLKEVMIEYYRTGEVSIPK